MKTSKYGSKAGSSTILQLMALGASTTMTKIDTYDWDNFTGSEFIMMTGLEIAKPPQALAVMSQNPD